MSLADIQSMKALKMAKQNASVLPSYMWNIDKGLRNWRAALAKAVDTNPNLVFFGDSITDGSKATSNTTGFVAQLRNALQLMTGMAGYGFKLNNYLQTDASWTTLQAGTNLTTLKATPTSTSASINESFLSIDIIYSTYTDGGTFTVQLDGTNVGTVNCNGSTSYHNVYTVTASSYGVHKITIVPASSGNTYIEGFIPKTGKSGVMVHKVGHPGIRAADYTDSNTIIASTSAFNPKLTVVMLGTNDAGQQVSLSTYQSTLDAIVKQALTTGDVLVVSMADRGDSGTLTIPYSSYVSTAKQVAMINNCAYMSLYDRWNSSFSWANNQGFMDADGIHPTQEGHTDIANAYISVLGGIPGNGFIKFIYDSMSVTNGVPYGDIQLDLAGTIRLLNELKILGQDFRMMTSDGVQDIFRFLPGSNKNNLYITTANSTYAQISLGPYGSIYSDNNGNLVFAARATANQMILFNSKIFGSSDTKGINSAVTSGATSAVISSINHQDGNYSVQVSPNWNTTYWVTNKTATGFTVNFGTAAPANATFDWFVIR